MVEKIYDTIRGILYDQFPKDYTGTPAVYDRQIEDWFFGDRKIISSPLCVILRGTQANIKDIGYGLREIEYSIGISICSSNDDQETSERVVQEAARIAHSILKTHRSMWICDLCPFCGKFPLSPIHYIDFGVITGVAIKSASIATTIAINGTYGNAYVRTGYGLSPNVNRTEILSSGLGIAQTTYTDSNVSLNFTLSGGSGHVGYSTTVMLDYMNNIVTNVNNYWSETHFTSSPSYYDWAGIAYQTITSFIEDWEAGIVTTDINLIKTNTIWTANLNNVVNNNIDLVRYLQDIQVGDVKPSDDGIDQMFLHTAEFTLKGKEIFSVDTFGPNNVNVNAV